MQPVTIALLGEPVAWARARLGARGIPFTPEKQRNNAATLRLAAMEAMAGREPFDCPLHLDLLSELAIPRSWSQRKRQAAIIGEILPAKRPDLSNLVKQCEDAFNGVVFRDDALIVQAHLRKRYSTQPKLVATVAPVMARVAHERGDRVLDAALERTAAALEAEAEGAA